MFAQDRETVLFLWQRLDPRSRVRGVLLLAFSSFAATLLAPAAVAGQEGAGAQADSMAVADSLALDERVLGFLPPDRVRELLDAGGYVGDAPRRSAKLLKRLRAVTVACEGESAEAN